MAENVCSSTSPVATRAPKAAHLMFELLDARLDLSVGMAGAAARPHEVKACVAAIRSSSVPLVSTRTSGGTLARGYLRATYNRHSPASIRSSAAGTGRGRARWIGAGSQL